MPLPAAGSRRAVPKRGTRSAFNFNLLCRIVFLKAEKVRKLEPTSHLIEAG